MMLKSLLLAVVALAFCFCLQQTSAQDAETFTTGGTASGSMSFTNNNNVLSFDLTCTRVGNNGCYILFEYGPKRCTRILVESTDPAHTTGQKLVKENANCQQYGGSHGGPEAIVCSSETDSTPVCKGTNPGTVSNDFATVANGFTCSGNVNGNTVSGTCTRTLGANEAQFIKGDMVGNVASGPLGSGSSHSIRKVSHVMVGPADPEPIDPNYVEPVAGPNGSCNDYVNALAGIGRECVSRGPKDGGSCASTLCLRTECCGGDGGIQAIGSGSSTGTGGPDPIGGEATQPPGGYTPTPYTPEQGSTTVTLACQLLFQKILESENKVCPGNQYTATNRQCMEVGVCNRPDRCCNVNMVQNSGNAGSVASPAVAVVLASALAMLALLF